MSGRGARDGVLPDPAGQVAPLDEPHGEVADPLVLARLIQGDDILVLHAGQHPRLDPESGILQGVGPEDLQRHEAPGVAVPGLIDHPHAAASQLPQQVVSAERGGDPPDRIPIHDGGPCRVGLRPLFHRLDHREDGMDAARQRGVAGRVVVRGRTAHPASSRR